ncbi:MAG: hypothetical protein WAX38_02885 [Minisyncoccia bacterium]
MKIYVTHASSYDFKSELYAPLRNSKLNTAHEISLPHEKSSDQFSSRNFLLSQDVVLAEVSYPSTGQGIELGWAESLGIPIVCIYKKGCTYSVSLTSVSSEFFEYENSEDLLVQLEKRLG